MGVRARGVMRLKMTEKRGGGMVRSGVVIGLLGPW